MSRVRIIGIGSACGDDRIGWDAIAALEAGGLSGRYPAGSVEACRCERPGELLALLRDVDAAILVDALQSGARPGAVRKLDPHALATAGGLVSSHGFSVAESIALGRVLAILPSILLVYGVEASQAAPGTAPDPAVRAAIPGLLDMIADDLGRIIR